MNQSEMEELLRNCPRMREKLYARGFLLTNADINGNKHPFYGLWHKETVCDATLLISPQQSWYICHKGRYTMILIGHAYDPFAMQSDEQEILNDLCSFVHSKEDLYWEKVNRLTGIFTLCWFDEKGLIVVGDATGMQTTFYTSQDECYYVSSHAALIGELLSLQWDPYIKRLVNYRFFKLLGNSLPGDLTQFNNVKRLVPNHYIMYENRSWRHHRFYWPATVDKDYGEIVEECADIIHKNLKLITEKWTRPAISVTGGCDSKTTLACANGLYNCFTYFSYISSEAEKVDALAAHSICDRLKIDHHIYEIPEQDSNLENIEETQKILRWNSGDIKNSNANDVRKRNYFADKNDFDIEVKSWASEVGRAYYSKRFNGRKKFGAKPTPRACTTLYKFFFHNRRLVKDTDAVFADYLENFFEQAAKNPIPWQEQFFWEFRVPSWNGIVITGEHRYSFDITIPYNNRKLLELLVSAPIDDRIEDHVYAEIRKRMNPAIDATGIAVTNLKHTKNRARAENLYYILHTKIPF